MSEQNNQADKLSEEVAAEFELAGGAQPGVMKLPDHYGGQTVDWRTITLAEARELIKNAANCKIEKFRTFKYLKAKKQASGNQAGK